VLVHTFACDLASVLERKNALPHPRGLQEVRSGSQQILAAKCFQTLP
jgi:hypothetical protein